MERYRPRKERNPKPGRPRKAFVYRHRRHITRRFLVRALMEEIRFGTSITGLYGRLLVKAVVDLEPHLKPEADPRPMVIHED